MKTWPVQDAKARFSEFLDACLTHGPQMVTRRGTETAVLVPAAQWQRLQSAARPSIKELLLSPAARTEQLVPRRGAARRRRLEPLR
ncbi:MAG: type II toxin-antitoxin system Phd/YefM family antitoxin [Burkholderiaceae bacterium]|jgi:prevent-host-death family protein|nr:MAG: type II toxin-antitoxin system Phd/YefM family antitoxin [Burkholderiaceae bacterium]TBR72852.1 MAG: type II toxin-antitoxin system Phd/YefM family antitoxin [Burkholderiaceae bacterium]